MKTCQLKWCSSLIALAMLFSSILYAAESSNIPENPLPPTSDAVAVPVTSPVVAAPAPAIPDTTDKIVKQGWHLEQADIVSVINQVASLTGKSFVIDPRVNGKVTVIAAEPMTEQELYQVFLSVLQTLGYSAVESGSVIKIVPTSNTTALSSRVASARHPGRGDELVVRVVTIKHVQAVQMIPVLQPLLEHTSRITAYAPANTLIISGFAGNMTRLVEIIDQVDKAASDKADVIALKFANATQLVNLLNTLQNADRTNAMGANGSASVVADERTNQIILAGDKVARMRLRVLINELDKPSGNQNNGNTEVINLHYLNAKDFAPILNKVAEGEVKRLLPGVSNGSGSANQIAEVAAEENTNSLVVTAPKSILTNLRSIVQRLDVRPAQVLVEALIVEMNENDSDKFGIEWGISGANSADSTAFSTPGVGMGILRRGRFQALVAAIERTNGANVLSTPTVVVMNNKEANFSVGKEVQVKTNEMLTGAASATAPVINSSFTSKEVALSLKVTPQINRGNTVLLKIKQHDDSLQNPNNPGVTPIINKNEIETTVMINTDDTLVLGGLMSNDYTNAVDKTPLLGHFPLIGELFTFRDKHLEKKKLMVFIHPVIMYTPADGSRLSARKYDAVRQMEIDTQVPWRTHHDEPHERILPKRDQTVELPSPFE